MYAVKAPFTAAAAAAALALLSLARVCAFDDYVRVLYCGFWGICTTPQKARRRRRG